MKKYIFLLFVFTLGVYTFTVVHAAPHIKKHDYGSVIIAHIDDVAIVDVAVLTEPVHAPVLKVIDLPVQCSFLTSRTEAPRIRWQLKGNNYNQNHPPSSPIIFLKLHTCSLTTYRC